MRHSEYQFYENTTVPHDGIINERVSVFDKAIGENASSPQTWDSKKFTATNTRYNHRFEANHSAPSANPRENMKQSHKK
jgi:hypothetical protein